MAKDKTNKALIIPKNINSFTKITQENVKSFWGTGFIYMVMEKEKVVNSFCHRPRHVEKMSYTFPYLWDGGVLTSTVKCFNTEKQVDYDEWVLDLKKHMKKEFLQGRLYAAPVI